MKFAPRPENDFHAFYSTYFERCRARFPRIEAVAAKWTFEDLIPGLSDFDARLICRNGMTADDWVAMSLAVGQVHGDMTREFPQWARILEHLPGLNLTWAELADPKMYYPEFNQWSFYLGPGDKIEILRKTLGAREWSAHDEFFHIKKFSIYYGPYQRGIDPPINLGPYESKYPLHSRVWHYFVTPLQSALSIIGRRGIAGKTEALRRARDELEDAHIISRVLDILERHYEVPQLLQDPGMARFEKELEECLTAVYRRALPELELVRGQPGDTPEELRARVATVPVDPIRQFFEFTKFARLMKGRLLFYAEDIPHFDSIPCIRIDLGRMGANFVDKPLKAYGRWRYGADLSVANVAARLKGDVWTDADCEGVLTLARLAQLPDDPAMYKPVARQIAANFAPYLRAVEKLAVHLLAHAERSEAQDQPNIQQL